MNEAHLALIEEQRRAEAAKGEVCWAESPDSSPLSPKSPDSRLRLWIVAQEAVSKG